MIPTRRFVLALSALALGMDAARTAHANEGWYDLKADDGKPVMNLRLPVELFSKIDGLPGAIRIGNSAPDLTLVEFYDYNCPFCRKAAADLPGLLKANRDLEILLVNNPMLSPASKDAARVEFAIRKLAGDAAAYDFHRKMFALAGKADGAKALAAAEALKLDRADIEKRAAGQDIAAMIEAHLELAAAMAMSATPSYVIAAAGILGYPGPKSLQRIIANARKCEVVVCK